MGWFIDQAAKATVGSGKFAYNKLFAGNPIAAGFGVLTTAGYAMQGAEEWQNTDSKAMTTAKYGAALGIDLASDAVVNWATKPLEMLGPYGKAASLGIQVATNMIGPGFIAAFNAMDKDYERLKNKGSNYQMTQSSSQMLQRQLANLQGAGSNIAEMMHNAKDNIYDNLQDNEFKKPEILRGTNFKHTRRKMAPTFEI
ncbi:MAG: hypothetical protein PHY47_00490 [Lachnospiraceae bacterium]|nr:hypothetical protein [Lachnospiraceae bacterium]